MAFLCHLSLVWLLHCHCIRNIAKHYGKPLRVVSRLLEVLSCIEAGISTEVSQSCCHLCNLKRQPVRTKTKYDKSSKIMPASGWLSKKAPIRHIFTPPA